MAQLRAHHGAAAPDKIKVEASGRLGRNCAGDESSYPLSDTSRFSYMRLGATAWVMGAAAPNT